ncbi:hypothetical protein [Burkholderia glumae]
MISYQSDAFAKAAAFFRIETPDSFFDDAAEDVSVEQAAVSAAE